MAAKLGIQVNLGQHQVLKPQQILVSTLLQLPTIMLDQRIKTELEKNPLLEEVDSNDEIQDDEEDLTIDEDKDKEEEIQEEFETLEENTKSEEDKLNDEVQEDINVDELVQDEDNDIPEPRMPRERVEEDRDMPEPYRASMSESLIEQLHLLDLDEFEYLIAEYIIYNLRDDGYLDKDVTVESIALVMEANEEMVENVLKKVQTIEPAGIAARNLEECLTLQLERTNSDGHLDLHIQVLKECSGDLFKPPL